MQRRLATLISLAVFLLASSVLTAGLPLVYVITPRGAQRGTEVEVTFNGVRLTDVREIMCYSPGFTFDKLTVVNDQIVKAKVKIASNCELGEHCFRLRTATGLADLRTFFVGALPSVAQQNPAPQDFKAPQKVPLNSTIQGTIQAEQAHYYSVPCKKGQRLTAEIEAIRLGYTLFDPYIAILNSKRFELAVSDDTPLAGQDGVASVVIPEDGDYIIQVRETSFGGNDACHYRLHVGTFPRPRACIPSGGKPGQEVEVTFLGDVAGPIKKKVKLPDVAPPKFGLFAEDECGISPSPVPFRLTPHENALEKEPNEGHDAATPFVPQSQAMNGVIEKPGDVDFFRFTLKKGETYDINCFARRSRSPLDPVMVLYAKGGGALVGSDDNAGPDSYFRFTAPNDGEYVISIQDHLGKGGPDYIYRVEFSPVAAGVSLTIPKVDGNNQQNQERQSLAVPRGNRMAALVYTPRANFGGDLVLEPNGMPKGITLNADTMASMIDLMPVVFEAAPDAPVAGALCDLNVRHADPKVNIRGGYSQRVDLVYIQNVGSFTALEVTKAAVAVTEEVPFKVSIVEPKVPLVQNGSMNLKVVVERKGDFKGPVSVYMLWNPPGVGSAGGLTIQPNQTEILYPVNANAQAPARKWKIAMIAQGGLAHGPVWTSTQLANLEVAPPLVAMTMDRPAVEQGKEADLLCKLTVNKPFEGNAKVTLLGLPHAVTAPVMDMNKDTKELIFKVKTDKASPAGQHPSVFAQVLVTDQGEPILHNVGGTVLRIDPPPPAPAAPPPKAATPAPAAATKPAAKPLTRLEKLRLEQEEKRKAAEKPPQ